MRALSANRGDAPFRYGDLVRFLNTLRRQCPQQNVLECSLHGTVRSSGKRRPGAPNLVITVSSAKVLAFALPT